MSGDLIETLERRLQERSRELTGEGRLPLRDVVERLYPAIEEFRKKGVEYPVIAEYICNDSNGEIQISGGTLKKYYGEIKRKEKIQKGNSVEKKGRIKREGKLVSVPSQENTVEGISKRKESVLPEGSDNEDIELAY